jgi:hypothetical protein
MRTIGIGFCLLGLSAISSPARAAPDELDDLAAQYDAAQTRWFEAVRESGWENAPPHPAVDFLPKIRALAEKFAGGPGGLKALTWMVQHAHEAPNPNPAGGLPPDLDWALKQLAEHHVKDAGLASALEAMDSLRYFPGDFAAPLAEFYERVAEGNPDKSVKALALFNLGALLANDFGEPVGGESKRADNKKRATEIFRRIAKEFADTPAAESAAPFIFEMEHLQVGDTVPEIESVDIDGKPVRLSQFRGQVIVLDFWGFW